MEKLIEVKDENGKSVKLEVIDVLDVENNQYVVVSSKDSDDAYAYRANRKGKEIEYTSIGDGLEFQKVLKAYTEKHKNDKMN